MSKTINAYVAEVHQMAKDKGWHDGVPRSPLEIQMLITSEIAEACEEVRTDTPPYYEQDGKPCGEAVELVDAVIRIMDYFGVRGWDMEQVMEKKIAFNAGRSYRHGNKRL